MAYPLPVTVLDRAGITKAAPVTVASLTGFSLPRQDGRSFMEAKNADTVPHTVTLTTPGDVSGLAIADVVVTIPAGATRLLGPFGANVFGYADVAFTADGVTVNGIMEFTAYALPVV